MMTQNNWHNTNARTITTVLVACAMVLGVVGWLLEGSSAAQDATHEPVVADEVHAAIASNIDGRAYVLVLLREDGAPSPANDEWAAWVAQTQQDVLDAFELGEFELVHRPEGVAALTGRINARGVARLDQDKHVAAVGLDAMNGAYEDGVHSATAAEALKATSLLVVTKALAPPDGSAAPTAAAVAGGGGAQAAYAGVGLQRLRCPAAQSPGPERGQLEGQRRATRRGGAE